MSLRDGAREDAKALKESLQQLGYKVLLRENLTAEGMKSELERVKCEVIRESDDSFICCILSHGGAAGIYGIDGKVVTVEELGEMLEPDKCTALRDKPKIFFIQACRGGEVSKPVDLGEQPISSVPRKADYYFSYSTDYGHVALRSAYPQYLSKILVEDPCMSLDEIVMSVHNQLAKELTTVCVQGQLKLHLQIGQVVHTLRGPVYFQ